MADNLTDEIKVESNLAKNDIEAKREARKRRILENAKNRLEKLNGFAGRDGTVCNGKPAMVATPIVYPDPEIEHPDEIPMNSPLQQPFDNYDALGFSTQAAGGGLDGMFGNDQIFELLSQFSSQQTPPNWGQGQPQMSATSTTKLAKFLRTKLHIVLISILTYALFVTKNEKYISYSVFFPLLIWELTEAFLVKPYEKPSALFSNVIFMFAGVSPIYWNAVLKVVGTFNKIFKDVGVFMFFFALCQVLFTSFFKATYSAENVIYDTPEFAA